MQLFLGLPLPASAPLPDRPKGKHYCGVLAVWIPTISQISVDPHSVPDLSGSSQCLRSLSPRSVPDPCGSPRCPRSLWIPAMSQIPVDPHDVPDPCGSLQRPRSLWITTMSQIPVQPQIHLFPREEKPVAGECCPYTVIMSGSSGRGMSHPAALCS